MLKNYETKINIKNEKSKSIDKTEKIFKKEDVTEKDDIKQRTQVRIICLLHF